MKPTPILITFLIILTACQSTTKTPTTPIIQKEEAETVAEPSLLPPTPVPYIPPAVASEESGEETAAKAPAPPFPEDEWMLMSAGPDGEYINIPATEFELAPSTNMVRMRGVVWASPNLVVKTNLMER